MEKREDRRNEEEGREGRKKQTADDRPAERGVLFTALAEPDCQWDHANDHCQRRHDYRANAREASFQRCIPGILALAHLFTGKGDHQNAVGRRHAKEGTFKVVRVNRSTQQMPASAPGNAVMIMKGSSQD